ncbi:MAG: hypothetical protein FJ150_04580 [Euryarchaeota archaeon]|nr:hypothetical protein [Euryarchaeota archaeon]
MDKVEPELWRIYVTIAVGMGWLLFLAIWLFFYAAVFSLVQNIAIFIASLVAVGVIIIPIWVPWGMKHAD